MVFVSLKKRWYNTCVGVLFKYNEYFVVVWKKGEL